MLLRFVFIFLIYLYITLIDILSLFYFLLLFFVCAYVILLFFIFRFLFLFQFEFSSLCSFSSSIYILRYFWFISINKMLSIVLVHSNNSACILLNIQWYYLIYYY